MKKHQSTALNRRTFIKSSSLAAIGISITPSLLDAAEGKNLNFYNWDTYIGETTLADFKKKSGIKVKMDIFADNSELFAKLRAGNSVYDVIVPTNDYVPRFAEAKLLQPINHNLIPNIRNLDKTWMNLSFDKKNKYTLPYMWGTMGIGYRKSKVKGTKINSMKYVLDSSKFSKRIAWISEATTMFDMAMKYLGYDPENPTDKGIKAAEKLLIKQKKHVKVIAEDNGQDLLASGEVDLCVEWSGDIAQVNTEDPDIGYAVTADGSYRWCDNLAIPAGAPHPKNAHKFINYLLEAEVGKDLAEYISYGTPNKAAYKLTSKDYKNNKITFPADRVLKKMFFPKYNGENHVGKVEKAWTRVLAS